MGAAAGVNMATGALGTGMGVYDLIKGAKEQADARREMENYQRQKLTNVADGMQVSTLGSDLQRQEQARLAASQNQMLTDSGTRGIVGGLGKVQANNDNVMQQTGAGLDQQQKQINMMQAEDQARIRSMQEDREKADLSALSSQYQSGKMDSHMGAANILQGGAMFGQGYGMMPNSATPQSGFTTTGTTVDGANPAYQSPVGSNVTYDQNFVNGTGYQNMTVPNSPQQYQSNLGPQNAFGVFNQYPYYKQAGPQNI